MEVSRAKAPYQPDNNEEDAGASRIVSPSMSAAGIEPVETTYFLYLPEKLYHRLHLLESLGARIPMGCQYGVFGSPGK